MSRTIVFVIFLVATRAALFIRDTPPPPNATVSLIVGAAIALFGHYFWVKLVSPDLAKTEDSGNEVGEP